MAGWRGPRTARGDLATQTKTTAFARFPALQNALRFAAVCFPALANGYTFSRARHRQRSLQKFASSSDWFIELFIYLGLFIYLDLL